MDAIKRRLPQALIVFDTFHIVRHLLEAVDQVRKEEVRSVRSENLDLPKKTRYIWLKNPRNRTEIQNTKLSDLEKLNLRTNRAYLSKEAFRRFWDHTYPAAAKKYLGKRF